MPGTIGQTVQVSVGDRPHRLYDRAPARHCDRTQPPSGDCLRSCHHDSDDPGKRTMIVPHRLKIVMDDPATVTPTGSVPAFCGRLKTP
jgi:hypothetical protein